MSEPDDFLERLSPDDPHYQIAKRFYHQGWADSHGLTAKALAGQASFTDFVDGCVLTFQQGAATHVAIGDGSSASTRCTAIDDMLEKFIFHFNETLDKETKRLGKLKARTIKRDFFRRVSEIAARSKQQIHEKALAQDVVAEPNPPEQAAMPDIQMFRRWIEPIKVRLQRGLISPETALEELRSIANDKGKPVNLRWYISEQLDPLSPAAPPPEDSAADGLRAALKQPTENIRRKAVVIILERIMATPAIRDYQAARRYHEQIDAIRGRSAEVSIAQQPSSIISESEPNTFDDPAAALAVARQAFVMPILTARGWSRGKWGTKAGVGKNCVYEYLDGKRRLSPPNRKAMAEALGLKPKDLPK